MVRKHLVRYERVNLFFYSLMDNGLLTKIFQSRWLHIGQILSFFAWFACFLGAPVLGPSRSGQDSAILPARVANHSSGFGSCCLLAELVL